MVGGKVYVRAKDESVNTADGILFSIYSDDADKVARAAERIGLTVHRDSIRISNSEYIEVSDNVQNLIDKVDAEKVAKAEKEHSSITEYQKTNC